ncbi:MAG: prolyl oligopeptidase family serine peptidase [Planctomycetaceae bacterium]|jgi:prolyl oligopeptidase|nr:prolyl oligopeptidase family serine peptidase [Planctomycetaceae bacterium]
MMTIFYFLIDFRTNIFFAMILTTIFVSNLLANDFGYPKPKRLEQQEEYFGTTVADPYRWMETNDTPELTAWINAENQLTEKYLNAIPFRNDIQKRLTEVVNYPKYSLPWNRTGKRFFFKNDGLQNQSVLYILDTPESKPRVLLDPNKLSNDGTVSLQNAVVSKDGIYLAYSLARSGSDWKEINVLKIDSGEKLPDQLNWVKFSDIAWHGSGFYYSRYDAPPEEKKLTAKNENHKIFFHQLGTDQQEDLLIREDREHPLRNRNAITDQEQQYLFVYENESTYGNTLEFKNLTQPGALFQTIVSDFQSEQEVVTVLHDMFYLLTDRNASNKRFVAVDPKKPQPEYWLDIIPESDSLLQHVVCIGGKFIATYLKDASNIVYVYDVTGKRLREIELPTLGIAGFSGNKDETEFFQSFTSYLYPTVVYRCDIETGECSELFPSDIDFKPENYVTERVWYENSEKNKVPMFLTYKKGIVRNGHNPVLLYGYGGFNISVSPAFSAYRLPFLEHGGIFAHVVLRGGGEYGENWHQAGTKLQKQNVFDDFAAAATFLINEQYTSPQKLAIQGGSNGGLLVGASVTQHPELFRAAVIQVGVLDMLRYHKFTIGWAWATDYGTSEESKEMFEYLFRYSPLHNIKSGVDYPAILVTTSDHDDRVVPAHSFKFTAEMQAKSSSNNPVLIRIETKAGHGAGKPVSKRIEESADIWTFIMDQLGMKW